MRVQDIFTFRAMKNIDLILEAISGYEGILKRALMLSLTSASGQMSKMVFAVSMRGKKSGTPNNRVEVGSWVIGFWRPRRHFEINVWNCFESRVKRLLASRRHDRRSLDPSRLSLRPDLFSRIRSGILWYNDFLDRPARVQK